MTRPAVLLVEDNADDIELTRLAFAEAGITHPLVVLRDGAQALDYLFARGAHAQRDRTELPAMVLLDLNLPRVDGREVMRAIRAEPLTQALPVIALSSSAQPFDIDASFASGVDSYLQKPVDFARFIEEMRRLRARWLDDNEAPAS